MKIILYLKKILYLCTRNSFHAVELINRQGCLRRLPGAVVPDVQPEKSGCPIFTNCPKRRDIIEKVKDLLFLSCIQDKKVLLLSRI